MFPGELADPRAGSGGVQAKPGIMCARMEEHFQQEAATMLMMPANRVRGAMRTASWVPLDQYPHYETNVCKYTVMQVTEQGNNWRRDKKRQILYAETGVPSRRWQ